MKHQKLYFLLLLSLFACLLLTACGLSDGAAAGIEPVSSESSASFSASPSIYSPVPSAPVTPSPSASPVPPSPAATETVPPTAEPSSAPSLSLWCAESAASSELTQYVNLFNAGSTGITVQMTIFPDSEALDAALASSAPDLLFCDRSLPDELGLSICAFDVLGYDVPVLLTNDAALEQLYGSPSALNACSFNRLCELAAAASSGTPFLAASSFTTVFETCLLSSGSSLSSDRSANLGNPDYISVYNLLAECAYSGNLVTDVQDLSSFINRNTVCMFTSSKSLAGQDLTGLSVSPFPQLENASDTPSCVATEYGLAVLSGSAVSLEESRSFFVWLNESGFSSPLALSSGLIPASPAGFYPSDMLSATLNTIYTEYRLIVEENRHLSSEDCEAFDLECRATFSSF